MKLAEKILKEEGYKIKVLLNDLVIAKKDILLIFSEMGEYY